MPPSYTASRHSSSLPRPSPYVRLHHARRRHPSLCGHPPPRRATLPRHFSHLLVRAAIMRHTAIPHHAAIHHRAASPPRPSTAAPHSALTCRGHGMHRATTILTPLGEGHRRPRHRLPRLSKDHDRKKYMLEAYVSSVSEV
jgi:hypothetical protein